MVNKQFLMLESAQDFYPPSDHKVHKTRNSLWFVISLVLVVFFVLTTFWYSKLYLNNRSLNVYIVTSGNNSILSHFSLQDVIDILQQKEKESTKHAKTTNLPPTLPDYVSDAACFDVLDLDKLDCYPDAPVTEEQCLKRGCCYHATFDSADQISFPYPPLNIPYCYYPSNYVGYQVNNISRTSKGVTAFLQRVAPSGFPNDISQLYLSVEGVDENTVRIKITDYNNMRYEAPLKVLEKKTIDESPLYDIQLFPSGDLFVTRKSSGIRVFSTNVSVLTYSDQFLQLSTMVPTTNVYGLGETYQNLQKNFNWTRVTMFNRDNFPHPNTNLYGTQPFYLCLENDYNAHGVFLINSNSMDVVLQPKPAITFRTIGGILDFFVFLGPSSGDVVTQYTNVVGLPFMPPYWSLGFHLCRYGYGSLNETKKVFQRTRDANIPFDVQWNDIDYMERQNIFTYDKVNFDGLPDFVNDLHNIGMHYVIIIDPGLSNIETPGTYPPYDEGVKENLLVKNNTGGIFIGKVWNVGTTVFPDFSHPAAAEYWRRQFQSFHDLIPFDGAWIDMNEPSNFYDGTINGCPKDSSLENPPYIPGGQEPLSTKTLCMTAQHYYTVHYNLHSTFALYEAYATNYALRKVVKKRPFIISRATFAGQGRYSGHWSGDIASSWEDMRYSIIDLLNFNLFGMPMMGSDICGFRDDTTVELCARWSALGSFYPFSRNHNDLKKKDQDPVALGEPVISAARNTLSTRYMLLPYLYSLFYESHVFGKTVARPLFFEFPNDRATYSIDEQFLWGSALMINPALYPGMKNVTAYFPNSIWYDFYTGERLNVSEQNMTFAAPYDTINLALRGGYILPQQYHNTTTTESRQNKFFLLAGLNEIAEASGSLYWDDGNTIGSFEDGHYNLVEFHIAKGLLKSKVTHLGYETNMELDLIKICGISAKPTNVYINANVTTFGFDRYNCLTVFINGAVGLLDDFMVSWKF